MKDLSKYKNMTIIHLEERWFKLSVCLFYLGKSYKYYRVQFNAKQSSTSKFSLIRNIYVPPIHTRVIGKSASYLPKFETKLYFS